MKHTPGPYRRCCYRVIAESPDNRDLSIARCQPDDGVGVHRVKSEDECVSNADRIVLALSCHDDLLEALELAGQIIAIDLKQFDARGRDVEDQVATLEIIQAAIAKAKGESS